MNNRHASNFMLFTFIMAIMTSCSPTKIMLDVPEQLITEADKIKVSGVKGKGIPGSKRALKFEREFSGEFKDGWTFETDIYNKTPGGVFSAESAKRNLFLNLGIGINDVTSRLIDKYQFKLSDKKSSVIVVCRQQYLGKSTSYDILNRANFSIANRQISSFAATILLSNNSVIADWFLELNYDRETPGGIIATTLREGMAIENGFVTNKTDTIQIKSLQIKRNAEKLPENSAFKSFDVVGGYEFKLKDKIIGIVDLFNPSIWLFVEPNTNYKTIVVAAATALLLRNR